MGSGRSLGDFPRATWFEAYGQEAENVRDRLDPTLVKFLEKAYGPTEGSFYYWVTGLMPPEGLWYLHDGFDDRYLTLYIQNAVIGTKADGLRFDVAI